MAKLTIRQQNAMLEAIRQIRELGEYTVRYTTVTTSRFDSAAFKKTHAELYAQYTVPSTSKRFSIS